MAGFMEEVAYIKGLAEGLLEDMAREPHVRIIKRMVELNERMAQKIDDLESRCAELAGYAETLDGDLDRLEHKVYGIAAEGAAEGSCPACNERLIFDADSLSSGVELECPACKQSVAMPLVR